jgi:hypothetical protein
MAMGVLMPSVGWSIMVIVLLMVECFDPRPRGEPNMARRVEEFPETSGRYPWEEWLDGSVWELTVGDDFRGTASTFRSAAITQARKRGGKVRTAVQKGSGPDEHDRLYLQFMRPEEVEARESGQTSPVNRGR